MEHSGWLKKKKKTSEHSELKNKQDEAKAKTEIKIFFHAWSSNAWWSKNY